MSTGHSPVIPPYILSPQLRSLKFALKHHSRQTACHKQSTMKTNTAPLYPRGSGCWRFFGQQVFIYSVYVNMIPRTAVMLSGRCLVAFCS